jgi:DNA repair protein RecO (recombination protein O)
MLMSSSPSANQNQDKAYVLHSRAYQNTSLIVEMFTRENGRVTLVAKGAKRTGSPFQGLLQSFLPLFISWGGRSEMKTLYKAENVSGAVKLQGDLLYSGFYLNELIMYLLHKHEAHASLFDQYHQCLNNLQHVDDSELTLRYFELELLEALGYGISLEQDLHSGEPVQPDKQYQYDMELGVIPSSGNKSSALEVSGKTLLALAQRTVSTENEKREAKRLLRTVLEYHLDGRPLKTRELFLHKSKFSLSH